MRSVASLLVEACFPRYSAGGKEKNSQKVVEYFRKRVYSNRNSENNSYMTE